MNDQITPTALQQLRQLVSSTDALPPWATVEEVMAYLTGQIARHRDDDAWRARLSEHLLALQDGGSDGAARSPWRTLVTRANLDALVAELSGPVDAADHRPVAAVLRGLSVPAILGLSALTMAVGCGAVCPEADGIPRGEQETYCDLVDYINGAELDAATRDGLLDCMPDLTAADRQDLVDLFATASPEEIAERLTTLAIDECGLSVDDDDTGDDDTMVNDDDTSDDDAGH